MTHTLTCPTCGHRTTISDSTPRQIICSHCLSWMDNPYGQQGPLPPQFSFPVEDQVRRDTRWSRLAAMMALAVVIAGAIFLAKFNWPIASFLILLCVLFGALMIYYPFEAGAIALGLLRVLILIVVIFGLFVLLVMSMCGQIFV